VSAGYYPASIIERNPNDVWVVGAARNPPSGCAGLAAAEHWNGARWRASPLPKVCNTLLSRGDATMHGTVWAVGYACGDSDCEGSGRRCCLGCAGRHERGRL
jgi:hypothetical protein